LKIAVNDLIDVLKQQKNIIEELIELSEEQLQVLKDDDVKKLSDITVLQEENGRELALLEKKRREIITVYSKKIDEDIKALNELFEYININDKITLQNLADEIKEKNEKLKQNNETNRLLLKQGLSYTNKILSCFNKNENKVYGKTGNIKNKNTARSLNKSV
jgi:flagellar biosynthesis/type III secretory pathway chaperone